MDSDDTIAPEMYEMLYRLATEHHADMAVCSFLLVDEQGNPMEEARKEPQTVVYTQEQAISRIATGDFQPAWNKLYRKEIFAELRYPEGKLNEDTFLLPHVMEQVTRVAHTRQQCYYYRQRKNSIMGEKKRLKNYDAVEAAYGCWQYLLYNGKTEALTAGAKFVLGSTRTVYCGLSPKDRKAPRSKEMMKLQRGVAWCTFRAGAFSIELLLRTVFFQLCPMGYGTLQKWYKQYKE